MSEYRLGDIIDDYCVKCKRIMNHAVVSMLNAEPAKVRCRTCHNDHDYRHEQPPPPKVDARKQALFNEVLAKVAPGSVADAADAVDPVGAADTVDVADVEPEEIPEGDGAAPVEEAKPAKPKVKAKAKAKGRK
ncbi:MAG TPA: hypothetical protein VMU80_11505 [Bryobacteraceae bacterium]|nr:hypothetical protein [Bryobacteraceae bacterium]